MRAVVYGGRSGSFRPFVFVKRDTRCFSQCDQAVQTPPADQPRRREPLSVYRLLERTDAITFTRRDALRLRLQSDSWGGFGGGGGKGHAGPSGLQGPQAPRDAQTRECGILITSVFWGNWMADLWKCFCTFSVISGSVKFFTAATLGHRRPASEKQKPAQEFLDVRSPSADSIPLRQQTFLHCPFLDSSNSQIRGRWSSPMRSLQAVKPRDPDPVHPKTWHS